VTIDTWNPTQYDKFQREREQPFYDLLAMIRPSPGMRVVDLGCGTGKLTRQLHARLAARETLGIDRSARMLAVQRDEPATAGLTFAVGTVESFLAAAGAHDLLFSNAVFHWIEDHERLLAQLATKLAPGGQLAFQVPAMHDEVSHLVADELSEHEPFASALGGWRRARTVLTPEAYARLLFRIGFVDPQARLIVYPHVLAGPEAVVEWMRGTLLAEYEKRLPPDLFARFVEEYQARLMPQLESTRPFFFPFKRVLCWGQRPDAGHDGHHA
jgi:trans-aconitate 2-methyltransferase